MTSSSSSGSGGSDRGDLDEQFAAAQARVKPITGLGNETLLTLYALFKQASVGDANGGRPGMVDLRGRAKYDAWAKRAGMARDAAKAAYIAAVEAIMAERKN